MHHTMRVSRSCTRSASASTTGTAHYANAANGGVATVKFRVTVKGYTMDGRLISLEQIIQ